MVPAMWCIRPRPAATALGIVERSSLADSGAAGGVSGREGATGVTHHRHEGDDTMTTAMVMPGNTADIFLVHFFGGGLPDERYVVERFKPHRQQNRITG